MDRLFNKLFLFLYGILLFVTPFLMYHRTSELFEFNKMLFIYFITFLVISLWISKMICYKKIIIKKTIFDVPILLFLFSQIFSMLFSIDGHTSIFGYYGRFNGGLLSIISYIILYYALVSNINGENALVYVSPLLKISLASSIIVILWGLPGKFGYDLTCYLFTGALNNSCWTDQFRPSERMFSTLGQPNWLGAYLAINFFIGLYFFFKKNPLNKYFIFYFLYLILNFSAILFTRSRSALLAVVVSLGLFFTYFFFRRDGKFYVSTLIKRYISLILLLLIPTFLFKTGIPKVDRFLLNPLRLIRPVSPISPTSQKSFITGVTESGDIRKIVWKGAIDLGLRYPLFGTGVETFAYSYYFVRPKEHNLTSEWDFIYNKAHNEYLNYFATTGFIGLGTYSLLILFILHVFVKKISKINPPVGGQKSIRQSAGKNQKLKSNLTIKQFNNNNILLTTSLLLAYVTVLITNFFGFSTTTINLYFYLIPALLITMTHPKQSDNETIKQSRISLSFSQKFLLITPVVICFVGSIFLISYFLADTNYALADNYQKIQDYPRAYVYLNKALSYKNEHVYEDKISSILANLALVAHYEKNKEVDANQFIKLSDSYNLKAINSSPKNVLYWKTRAKNYYLFYQINENDKNFQQTIDALEMAKTLSPTDPKIYYNQAMLYQTKLNKSNEVKALETVDKAIELKPNYRDGYFAKGLILKQLGKKEEAKEVFQYILKKLNTNDEEAKKELQNL